jgi:cobalt-zinc-cadmium resistance protein CzcA
MMHYLIETAVRFRWGVLFLTAVLLGLGIWSFQHQTIDAYPDISAVSVSIITTYTGRAPEEVEQKITIPIELAMRSVPKVEVVRSRTIFGLSIVQLVFEEGVDMYWARQRVTEVLSNMTFPPNVSPQLGSLGTSAGEVYRYELTNDGTHDLMELRELNEWVVQPRLLRAGVAEVTLFGGDLKQYSITFLPNQLERYDLTLANVIDAINANNTVAGGSYLNRGGQSFVIRGTGSIETIAQIENIFVKSVGGTPVYIRDVARVQAIARPPSGIYMKDDNAYTVEGIVIMRRGENPSQVLEKVKEAVEDLNKNILPAGVKVEPFYDREHLVQSTIHTVAHSVLLGITLVVLVLLLFLGRPAMAGLVALTIPFALLFAISLMYFTGIPLGLLSIGAIDFGIIVDGAIITAENIARRLGEMTADEKRQGVTGTILKATLEVQRPVFFSMLMIVAAYLPLLSLTSIEGLLFRPMAQTMVFALIGAMLFALFVVPVLATFIFRHGYVEWENPLLRWFRPTYSALVRGFLRCRYLVTAAMFCVLAVIFLQFVPRLGIEFLPYMDEGVIWLRANFPEGTSLQQNHEFGERIRDIVREFPDIQFVSVQLGRNDSNTDPWPPSRTEMMLGPKPREQWQQFRSKSELIAALRGRLEAEFPTSRFNFTQPIIDNVTEDTNGTSANLAVEFTGGNSETLRGLAEKTVAMLKSIPGAVDVNIEQEGPQSQLKIDPNQALCARYKVKKDDVDKLINTAIGGEPISTLYEGERKFDIVLKFSPEYVQSPRAIGRLPVKTDDGLVTLSQVASIQLVDGQTLIARENSKRRLTVRCDIVGRDQGGFVEEAQRRFDKDIRPEMPAGVQESWIGLFKNLEHASQHFTIVLPIAVLLIFVLLLITFQSPRAALLVLMGIPFACIGGVLALYARGMHLNVSAGVGFVALFGIAIMDGVLMVRGINVQRQLGLDLDSAISQGALQRLRPILMTAIVAIFGLLPASLATGLGSDVQRPLATVIVWGLFSSTVLTLFVIPVFYRLFPPGLPKTSAPVSADAH